MMVSARRVLEEGDEVRYRFGFDEAFDRVLVISKKTLRASVEDGNFESPASAITSKIIRTFRSTGAFPPGVVFAS
ncbi:hypothetical protein [Micromonospora globispora]|uniref:hypothetical protein n=1 Tax=Micromonospora globispora TaxID=1450148 RepID=UPI001FAE9403|nr:hypothetical protein [Micromonospora globispora]